MYTGLCLIFYQSDICNAVALLIKQRFIKRFLFYFYIHRRLRGALTTDPVTLSKQPFFTGIPQISF